jgi:hypothetical protein
MTVINSEVNKHTSFLLHNIINYVCKKFHDTDPRVNIDLPESCSLCAFSKTIFEMVDNFLNSEKAPSKSDISEKVTA